MAGWKYLVPVLLCAVAGAESGWKAGVARVDITPEHPIVLLGYGDRTGPFESVAAPIFAKALALEDAQGRRGVLVTADLVGFQAAVLTDEVARRISKSTGLTRDQLLFNASHSHTGPLVSLDPWPEPNPVAHPPLRSEDREKTIAYTLALQDKLVALVEEALNALAPATLAWGEGEVPFPMNRRLPREDRVVMADNPEGAVDRRVPVLRVAAPDGAPRAVILGCACHNTALTGADNVIAGDYAGVAQHALEAGTPGMQAMFMSGGGGDANPSPRGAMSFAEAHGETLAREVQRVLEGDLLPLSPSLATSYALARLPMQRLNRAEIELRAQLPSAEAVMATHMLRVLDEGLALPSEYVAPIALWRLGELPLVALPGEPMADYATLVRNTLNLDSVWVTGYNNDCFGYLPTARVVQEGGHENIGVTLWLWGQHLRQNAGFFAHEVEAVVLTTVRRLWEQGH